MKKIIYAFLALILVLFFAIYGLLFTSLGNAAIVNIAQNKVKQDFGLDLNITRLSLRPSSLDLQAILNNALKLELDGNLSLFGLGFDLEYKLEANKNHTQNAGLNLKDLHFAGKIQGSINDFIANGKGLLFDSNIILDSRIYKLRPLDLQLDAQKLNLEKILIFLHQDPYFKGQIDLVAKISNKDLKPDGNAIIKLDINDINHAQIQKKIKVNLPKNSDLNSKILATIKDNRIFITSQTQNSYLNLTSQKTLYDLTQDSLQTDFNLKILDLSQLESLTQTKLNGALDLSGDLLFARSVLRDLDAKISGLGGEASIRVKEGKLHLLLDAVRLEKILALAGYGSLASGNLNANLTSEALDLKNFNAEAKIDNAVIDPQEIKKITHLSFPNASLSLQAQADSNNGKISYNALLNSTLLEVKKLSGSYDSNNAELKLVAMASIDDLSQFSTLAGQRLQGSMLLNSKIHLIGSQIQNLDIDANLADGKITARSGGKDLDVSVENLDIQKALLIAGLPQYAGGVLNGKARLSSLDLKKLSGDVNLNAKGVLNASALSQILDKKFPENAHFDLKAKAFLKDSVADFEASLHSTLGNLKSLKGSFNPNPLTLNSNFTLALNDFSKLGFLVERKLSGKADFEGMLSFDKKPKALITSENLFEGKLRASLENDALKASLKGVDLSSLARGVDVIDLYEGRADADIDYNLLSQSGTAGLNMSEGKLKQNPITNAIKLLTFKDITDNVFHSAKAQATMRKELVDFSLNMQAQNAHISIHQARINTDNQHIKIPFEAQFNQANFKGIIEGTSEDPKVKLSTESFKNTLKNILNDTVKKPTEDGKLDKLLDKIF